jgi:hypothetical protein
MPPASPADPDPVFAIGITGHRLNRLPEAGRASVKAELGRLLDRMLAQSTRLVLVSGLAEGSDRLAADAALARGIALRAILPFAAEEYEKDFPDPDSKAAFRWLLSKAERISALPGDRARADAAYEAAGLAMLDAARILLAVWDGGPSAGRGGTTDIVTRATARGIPVLWIDPAGQRAAIPYGGTALDCDESITVAFAHSAI